MGLESKIKKEKWVVEFADGAKKKYNNQGCWVARDEAVEWIDVYSGGVW